MRVTGLRCEYLICPKAVDEHCPLFSWEIVGEGKSAKQLGYRLLVSEKAEDLDGEKECISKRSETRTDKTVAVEYNGKPLKPFTKYYWRVIVRTPECRILSDISYFITGRMDSRWQSKWIGKTEHHGKKRNAGAPSPYIFKNFTVGDGVKEALLFATARGVYSGFINGKRISDEIFAPGWTDFNKTFYYQGYDVTPLVKSGKNAVGVILGDGWYFGNLSAVGRNQYGNYPRLFTALLIIRYNDGREERIMTDESWRSAEGPIRYADLQTGEYYDASMELDGFATAGYKGTSEAVTVRTVRERITGQKGEPIKTDGEMVPAAYNRVKGKHIFDMGQNMVGRIRLKVKGEKGRKIKLRYGEMLNTDKSLYTANLRSCEATDWYVCKGTGDFEIWESEFTIHGFRYVELSGIDYTPSLDTVIGIVIHNALTPTASFECNDGLVNKLVSNALWGQKGNFLAVPTDCPQRDERLGWTGDSEIFCQSGCYNMYSEAFYEKYVQDIMDEQMENGAFTDIAPYIYWPNGNPLVGYGNAAWGDAGVIIPWLLYLNYGNKRVLSRCYGKIVKYIDCLYNTSSDGIREPICYGDWLCVGTPVPFPVIDTAYMIKVTDLASKIASVLGKTEDEKLFASRSAKYRDGFLRHFVSEDGTITEDTQTGYLLAIRFEIVPKDSEMHKKFVKKLIGAIEKANYHLTTGFVGVKELLPVLCDEGYSDIAYRILQNRTYPSWLYSVVNGATTIWERWNSYTLEDGFADIAMNSFNHYSLGSVVEWLYGYAAGIREQTPGWEHFSIIPEISSLEKVTAHYDSPKGRIVSNWKRFGDGYEMEIEIPANTTATVKLPAGKTSVITERNGKKLDFVFKDGRFVAEAEPGRYYFTVR